MELQVSGLPAIDPKKAESNISEKKIGERIKRLRLKRSMGLVEMGRQTGLSASFLSQLETGRVVPTLRNLARIAAVFAKDLAYFFESETNTVFRIQRKKERARMPQSGVEVPTYYFESLGFPLPDRSLDSYLAEFIPLKKNMEVRSHVHAGFEFLYVLNGQLEIHYGSQSHVLDSGDAVSFDASTPHSYRCGGETPTTAIIVTVHQGQHLGHPSANSAVSNQAGAANGRGNGAVTAMPKSNSSGHTNPVAETGTLVMKAARPKTSPPGAHAETAGTNPETVRRSSAR